MNYILLNRYAIPTIRGISQRMEEPHRIVFRQMHDKVQFNANDTVIRWATSKVHRFNGARVLNTARGIALACNKAKSRMLMQEKEINVPFSWFDQDEDESFIYPFIARPFNHRKGENFYIIKNDSELEKFASQVMAEDHEVDWYYSSLIEKTNEYRVHVAHGKVLFIHEKPLVEGEIRANQHITHQSWGKVLPWEEYRREMCKVACDAVKCLGLDTGGVDVMKGKDKKYYVCEVNTAPTMTDNDYALTRYAKYFDWFLRHPEAVWWDYSNWEAGSSFAWKNKQLEE